MALQRPYNDRLNGISPDFLDAKSIRQYLYEEHKKRCILSEFTGEGYDNIVQRKYIKEKDGTVALFARLQKLDKTKLVPFGGPSVQTVLQKPQIDSCMVQAFGQRAAEGLEEISLTKIESTLEIAVNDAQRHLEKLMRETIDDALLRALVAGYNFNTTNGAYPRACRSVAGNGLDVVWNGGAKLFTQLVTAFNVQAAGDIAQHKMTARHVERLVQKARANPYGVDRIEPVSCVKNDVTYSDKYVLLMPPSVAANLRADPVFMSTHYTVGRDLGNGQGSILHNADYLGCIYDVECYSVPDMETVYVDPKDPTSAKCFIDESREYKNDVAHQQIGWSVLLGAGALGELIAPYHIGIDYNNGDDKISIAMGLIHGCAPLKFLAPKFAKEGNASLAAVKIEQGIIHSFTFI